MALAREVGRRDVERTARHTSQAMGSSELGIPAPAPVQPGQKLQIEVLRVHPWRDGRTVDQDQVDDLPPGGELVMTPIDDQPATPPLELISTAFRLEHDRAGQQVLRDGKRLPLSHREYRLFRYLLDHPGQLLSHDQLVASVWEEPPVAESGVLASCLSRLRERLGPAGKRLIETRRGGGYRFVPEPRPS